MEPAQLKAEAISAIEQQHIHTARPLWSQICEIEPHDIDNWLILSAIDERLGFYNAALDHLKIPFRLDSEDIDVWHKSAEIKWQQRNFQGALVDLSQALSLDFPNFELRAQFADWLFQLHHYKQALVHYIYFLKTGKCQLAHLVSALSCLYLLNEEKCVKQAPQLTCSLNRFEPSALAQSVTDCVLYHCSSAPEIKPNKAIIDAIPLFESVKERIGEQQHKINWARFFENNAHTESSVVSKPRHEFYQAMAKWLQKSIFNSGELTAIREFGCGTGVFGRYLKAHDKDLLLTGVEYSDHVLSVANRTDGYDTLIHASQLIYSDAKDSENSHCVIIQVRVSAHQNRLSLLKQLLDDKDRQPVIVVVFANNSVDKHQIIDLLKSTSISHREHNFDTKSDYTDCLIINPKSEVKASPKSHDNDAPENAGNALISAVSSLKEGNFKQVIELSEQALAYKQGAAQALFNLGLCEQEAGNFRKALSFYRQARIGYYGFADNWFQIGVIHQHAENSSAAFNCYRQCLTHNPTHVAAMQNLIGLYFAQGNIDAVWHYLRLMLVQNALNEPLLDKVKITVEQIKHEKLDQHYAEFLGSDEWVKAQIAAAFEAKYFDRARKLLAQLDHNEESEFLTSQLDEKSGALSRAKNRLVRLSEANPKNFIYAQGVASISAAQGQIRDAYEAWLKAIEGPSAEEKVLQNFLFYANYCDFLDDEAVSRVHFDWANALVKSVSGQPEKNKSRWHALRQRKKLRIGYISGDFRMHSVSMFLYNLFKHHDAARYSVYCYSTTPNEDPMTIKLRFFTDCWRNVRSLDDAALARRIKQDKIDILVDLAGHTAENRMPVFIGRAAPIQCTYLGYPNTTGLKEIDYRLTDNEADPIGQTEHLHSEKLIRLPHGFLSYSRHHASTPITLYETQPSSRHYTYACCNNIYKVNEQVVRVFSKILNKAPNTNLLLKAHNLNNPEIIEYYRSLFESHGVGSEQVHLMNTIDMDEHQNLYNTIDIALDPFPYNGTTTTCDALWMGVPVLALAGTRHAGRVGVSILTRIGLTDWIAQSEQEYVDKAVKYAADRQYLRGIKQSMRKRMLDSPLMQPTTVIKDIEAEYETMWKNAINKSE